MSSADRPISARALARALRRLPVFPLPDVVLFPHALLPLHVFEPRYRALTRDVLAGAKLVGVPLLVEQEVPGAAPPHFAPIFGVGEVMMAQELPDGRFNLVLRGRARVRLDEELITDEPYRLVKAVEIADDLPRPPEDLD